MHFFNNTYTAATHNKVVHHTDTKATKAAKLAKPAEQTDPTEKKIKHPISNPYNTLYFCVNYFCNKDIFTLPTTVNNLNYDIYIKDYRMIVQLNICCPTNIYKNIGVEKNRNR